MNEQERSSCTVPGELNTEQRWLAAGVGTDRPIDTLMFCDPSQVSQELYDLNISTAHW